MCGILAGFETNINYEHYESALGLLSHRGPDNLSFFVHENLFLGHTRLSIIDTSNNSNQPMHLKNRFTIIFNGEIYNYKELRVELQDLGCKFTTDSDTEVLLHGYSLWKSDLLPKLLGMFAFCIYDRKEKYLFVARDHIGIKPLYYVDDSGVIFSSEIKTILAVKPFKRKINKDIIPGYIAHRYAYGRNTFFSGINTFPPGQYAIIKQNKIRFFQWWRLNNHTKSYYDKTDIIDKTLEHFRNAVDSHTISDVPISTFLSGGVDSSAITALAAASSKKKINAFTIGFANSDDYQNEFKYSDLAAKNSKILLDKILYSEESYLDDCRELTRFKDAPLGIPNEPLLYAMSKEISKHAKVVLSGEGADEIYAGYGRIFGMALDVENQERKTNGGYNIDNFETPQNKLILENRVQKFLNLYRYVDLKELKAIFVDHDLVRSYGQEISTLTFDLMKESGRTSYFEQVRYFFVYFHLQGLLQRVDNCSMATSLEARVPFLSKKNMEFVWNISPDIIYHTEEIGNYSQQQFSEIRNIPKYILKKSLENILDSKILYRKKEGFPVPLFKILEPKIEALSSKFLDGGLVQMGIINRDYLRENLTKKDWLNKNSKFFWFLYSLELFMEEYF